MLRRTFLLGVGTSALTSRAAETSLGTIVFVQAGELWVRRLPDGHSKKLTTGGHIQSPSFSPSGEWIAYQNGDALHLIRRDGSRARQLPPGASKWLPTADVLAVASKEGIQLFRPTDDSNASRLVHEEAGVPVFSPDGEQLVYSNAVEKGRGPGGEPMRDGQLCRLVLTGAEREPQALVSKHLTGMLPYAWTRDARSVLYWENPDFSASVMADGLELFRIAVAGGSPQSLGVTVLAHEDMLALSPTQNKLAVAAGEGRETWSRKRIAIIDLDTAAVRYLTDENTSAICPSWSPDGKQIAYAAAPDAALAKPYLERRRIWVADASGATPPKQITKMTTIETRRRCGRLAAHTFCSVAWIATAAERYG